MPFITSIERLEREEGRAEGRIEGQVEGKANTLTKIFRRRFGRLPITLERQIRNLATPDLDQFIDASDDLQTSDSLKTWQKSHR